VLRWAALLAARACLQTTRTRIGIAIPPFLHLEPADPVSHVTTRVWAFEAEATGDSSYPLAVLVDPALPLAGRRGESDVTASGRLRLLTEERRLLMLGSDAGCLMGDDPLDGSRSGDCQCCVDI
jgi:hypothetical protein